MPEIASILQIASRGSKLSLALYDFAANIPSATTDASNLAKGVKDLSRALWQVSASQREDARITTHEARDAIADIVQQCQSVLTEIESVVPLDMIRDERSLTYGRKWEWNEVSKAKVLYLLGHLESLKLTLDVLSQAIRSVKVIEWSGYQPSNPMCLEAVELERMQLESLVVEQQLAFLHASQLFDVYHHLHSDSGFQLIPMDETAQAMTLFEEWAPNPSKLITYQNPALVVAAKARNETEKLAMVRRASSLYIDYLMERWTRILEIRRSQQPRVDSDDSGDEDVTPGPKHSNGVRGPPGPILTHIDEDDEPVITSSPGSPIGIPERTRRPRGPMSPTSPSSWNGRTGSYFPAPPVRPPASAGNSPRVSFSSSNTPRPVLSPKPTQAPPQDGRKRIQWRLRLGANYWDHENEKVVNSNTQLDPSQVSVDRNASTDILASYVSEEAIEDLGYHYTRASVPSGNSRQTKLETLYCIRRALTFTEVDALVNRSNQRWEQRYKKPRPQMTHPQLDRTVSSPLPKPGSYLQTPVDHHRSTSRSTSYRHERGHDGHRPRSARSSTSNTSDSDRDGNAVRSREGSRTSSRARRSSTSEARSSSKKGSGGSGGTKTGANLSKIAAGAGVAALLEGLFEVGAAL